MQPSNPHPFETLTPDFILDALEALGFEPDGRVFALNSYENRVYQIGLDEADPVIAKFYRPERWSREQILEEHNFCLELADAELPIVPPNLYNGESLLDYKGFMIALFERKGGYAPELDNLEHLYQLGKTIGRIHAMGAVKPFNHRPAITFQSFARDSVELISKDFISMGLKTAYDTLCRDLLEILEQRLAEVSPKQIRLHGDCHPGNILWRDGGPHFVDFDDARTGPAIQDIWMMLSGSKDDQRRQLSELIEGYEEFCDFDRAEIRLIEPLRTLRMLYYSAWLSRRWQDPAFIKSFPWFNTENYWSQHILELREQLSVLQQLDDWVLKL